MSVVTVEMQNQVSELYITFFGRAPDAEGMGHWVQALANGATVEEIGTAFANSPEFVSNYGGLTPAEAINKFYQNTLGRDADSAGLEYWENLIVNQGVSFATVAYSIVNTAFAGEGNPNVNQDDVALVNNKVTIAKYFSLTLASNDFALAQTAFVGVDTTQESVDRKEAELDAEVNAGTTYTLTTNIDNFTGTSANNLFTAAPGTWTILDDINGGGGTNTFEVSAATALAAPTGITVENMQIVEAAATTTITLNTTSWGTTDLTAITAAAANADVSLTTKAAEVAVFGGDDVAVIDVSTTAASTGSNITAVSLSGNLGAATLTGNAISAVTLSDLVGAGVANTTVVAKAGERDLTVTVDNVGGTTTFTDATATGVTLAAVNEASVGITLAAVKATELTLDGDVKLTVANANVAAAETIDVTGDSLVTVTAGTFTALETLTSADSTGGVKFDATLGNSVLFTGGEGDDTITLGATTKAIDMGAGKNTVNFTTTTFGVGGSVNGGSGTEDTLAISSANAATASASAAAQAAFADKLTGFEVLSLGATSAANTVNLDRLNGISYVKTAGASAALTLTNLAAAGTVEVNGAVTAASSVALKSATGTDDTINLKFSAANGFTNTAAITVADVENLNITTEDSDPDTAATALFVAEITAAAAKTVVIDGDVGFNATGLTATTITSLDASELSGPTAALGGLTWTSGALAAAATVEGSATGNNTVVATAATKAVTYTGGAGVDTVTIANAQDNVVTTGAGADVVVLGSGDNVVDGGAGDDSITVGAGNNTVTGGAGDDTFVISAINAASSSVYSIITDFTNGTNELDLAAVDGTSGFAADTTLGAQITGGSVFIDKLNIAAAGATGATNALANWFEYGGNTYLVVDNSNTTTFVAGTDFVVEFTGSVDLEDATIVAATGIFTLA